MAITKYNAKQATLAYATGAITWDTSTTLDAETLTGNVAEVKDMTLTTPEHTAERIPCLGNVTQTIGANARTAATVTGVVGAVFQNMALCVGTLNNWKLEGTLVLTGDEQFQHILGLDGGTAINATDHRYAVGNLHTSFYFAKNQLGTLRVFWNNGSETNAAALTNVWISKIGDIKPTGADGHYEVTFTAECLPKDGAVEWAD